MIDHYSPNLRNGRYDRRSLRDLERAYFDRDVGAVKNDLHCVRLADQLDLRGLCYLADPFDVVERDAGPFYRIGHGAVHRASVEIEQAKFFGQHLAERRFSRTRRAVDSDDHQFWVRTQAGSVFFTFGGSLSKTSL